MSDTPDLAQMREVAEKATLIKQRTDDDCTICAIAMAVGQPYEAVMGAATRAEHGYRFRDIPGTASPMAVLAELGIAAKRIASEVLSLNVWNRVLWGRRAILSVPSLNGFEGHHDVYWDGKILHDPTNATPYAADALSSTKPLSAVVLDERAAQRPLLDRIAELEGEREIQRIELIRSDNRADALYHQALDAEAQVSALQAQVDGLRERVGALEKVLKSIRTNSRARNAGAACDLIHELADNALTIQPPADEAEGGERQP